MQLIAHEKIEAPRADVWSRLIEFDRFERMASGHAQITRTAEAPLPAWAANLEWRGVSRDLTVSVSEMTAPERLVLAGAGSGILADVTVTLREIGPTTTGLEVGVALRGKSLGGKAIVQGLKIARAGVQEKFQKRISSIARSVSKGMA